MEDIAQSWRHQRQACLESECREELGWTCLSAAACVSRMTSLCCGCVGRYVGAPTSLPLVPWRRREPAPGRWLLKGWLWYTFASSTEWLMSDWRCARCRDVMMSCSSDTGCRALMLLRGGRALVKAWGEGTCPDSGCGWLGVEATCLLVTVVERLIPRPTAAICGRCAGVRCRWSVLLERRARGAPAFGGLEMTKLTSASKGDCVTHTSSRSLFFGEVWLSSGLGVPGSWSDSASVVRVGELGVLDNDVIHISRARTDSVRRSSALNWRECASRVCDVIMSWSWEMLCVRRGVRFDATLEWRNGCCCGCCLRRCCCWRFLMSLKWRMSFRSSLCSCVSISLTLTENKKSSVSHHSVQVLKSLKYYLMWVELWRTLFMSRCMRSAVAGARASSASLSWSSYFVCDVTELDPEEDDVVALLTSPSDLALFDDDTRDPASLNFTERKAFCKNEQEMRYCMT